MLKRLFRDYGVDREKFLGALAAVRGNQKVTSDTPEDTYEALKRYLRRTVETLVARLVIAQDPAPGATLRVFVKDGALAAEVVLTPELAQ